MSYEEDEFEILNENDEILLNVKTPKKIVEDVKLDGVLYLDEFDLNKMHPIDVNDIYNSPKIVAIGKPGSGKSKLIEAIIAFKQYICPVGQYFAGTEESHDFFDQQCTSVTTFNKLDLEAMTNYVKRQKLAKKYLANPWAMCILDDVTDDPKQLKNKVFGSFYKNGRKWASIFVLALQFALDLPSGIRGCVDYSFIFNDPSPANRKRLYENFAPGCVGSLSNWCTIMDQVCTKYRCLVVDNRSNSNDIKECLYWFKVDIAQLPSKNHKYCHPTAMDHDVQRKDPKYVENVL
jgi:hypothetical protein